MAVPAGGEAVMMKCEKYGKEFKTTMIATHQEYPFCGHSNPDKGVIGE